jgi:hypothetical protein
MKKKEKRVEPSLNPQIIDEHNWYYEEANKIVLIHEVRDLKDGKCIRTDQIEIPWRKLIKSLARCRHNHNNV